MPAHGSTLTIEVPREIVMTVFGPEDPDTFESRVLIVKAKPVRD
jgi:hypothetical protein